MSSEIVKKYSWLNVEFFTKVLSKCSSYDPDEAITDVELELATQLGDNYLSTVLRAEVKIEEKDGYIKSLYFIVKIQDGSFISNELIAKFNCFEKEFDLYESFINNFETILNDLVKFGPLCYYTADTPLKVLVLEDLSQMQYVMHDGIIGFDLEISTIVMKKIAQFHAASVIYREQNGSKSFKDYFKTGTFNLINKDEMEKFFNPMFKYYLEGLQNYEDYEKYYDIIKTWENRIYSGTCEALKYNANDFNVLNHGDLWINNILVQKKTNDILFVDFQMAFWGTPAYDILYFIMLSCSEDVRINKFDQLIETYHSELCASLATLNYEKTPPTLLQIHDDIKRRGILFAILTIDGLSGILFNRNEITNLDALYSSSENDVALKRSLFNNPLYIQVMKKMLPFLYERGFLHMDD